jgi:hypothetical protein
LPAKRAADPFCCSFYFKKFKGMTEMIVPPGLSSHIFPIQPADYHKMAASRKQHSLILRKYSPMQEFYFESISTIKRHTKNRTSFEIRFFSEDGYVRAEIISVQR